jgi:hypothetical protein
MAPTNNGRPFALRFKAPRTEPLERALLRLLLQEDSLTQDLHIVNSLPPDLRAVLGAMEPRAKHGARARSRRRRSWPAPQCSFSVRRGTCRAAPSGACP